ncbi:iridoid oxidase-like [Salvia miltiorrhiza]|uniref:Cytochrome P450 CYP76A35 n=1 Tax=Salvia miltiorrhiza TaxID=226208 RepID=A0A0B4VRI2_SALMI|nr:iridoid oxidase-like [Salvia miltiorrhiza]AJD25179.1 cytochrome P450 CYP76A35 [Salvia miltiorrhiza]
MAWLASLTWFTISFLVALLFWFKLKNRSSKLRLPPGPPGWPIIGNIFDLGTQPHRDFHILQSRYGPVLWLKLGNLNTVVVQSAAAAAELFKRNDLAFADRKTPDSMTACDYINGSLAQAPYNEYWRILRRLSSSELMVQKRINSSAQQRKKCIDKMIQWIREDASEFGEIQLDRYLLIMSFNLVSNFMLTRDIMDFKSEMGNEFLEAMHNFISWQGKPNVVDAFEFLKWLDPQGIRRRTKTHLEQLLKMVSVVVKERIQERNLQKGNGTRDFLDALLDYEGDGKGSVEKLSEKNINIIILEMFFGGTETTSNTTVWAMAELLRSPDSMRKLKAEIDRVVGPSRAVEEDDLNELTYLQAVAEETMRLHPPLPMLLPRKAREDTKFMGYNIPKDTTLIVNAWAIHRDPDSWDDPLSFKPERFLNSSIDHKGQHYEMIPFGSGRRSCVGMLMGERMVSLTLARLIQSFDWELPANISPETLDMREMTGLSLRMITPLKAVPRERGA